MRCLPSSHCESSSPLFPLPAATDCPLALSCSGLVPAEGVYELASDADALSLAYGKPTLHAITSNGLVVGCSVAATIGGLLFGFDQGLVSIILVMKQFLAVFPEIDSTISSRAGFMKGCAPFLSRPPRTSVLTLCPPFLQASHCTPRARCLNRCHRRWILFGPNQQEAHSR